MEQTQSNQKLNQRLRQYCQLTGVLAGAVPMTIPIPTQAAVVYTAVNQTLSADGDIFLDIAGVSSIQFVLSSSYLWLISNNWMDAMGNQYPVVLNLNDPISGGTGTWGGTTNKFLGGYAGNFAGESNKYIGIRFNSGGPKYGWIQVSVNAGITSFTVHDWAYEDTGGSIPAGISVSLPVEWGDIQVQALKEAIALSWVTVQEENSDRFEVERSEDGLAFASIGRVGASGNSQAPVGYRYVDEAILPNRRYYYRVKSVDLDGSTSYTSIVETVLPGTGLEVMGLYPQPVSGAATHLQINSANAERLALTLFDYQGREVYQQTREVKIGANEIELDFPKLSAGQYVLKVQARYEAKYVNVSVR